MTIVNRDKDKVYFRLIKNGRIITDPQNGIVYSCRDNKEIPVGSKSPLGYMVTSIASNKYIMLHRIIWMSVHGMIPNGLEINHINGDKTDNRIDNLEVVTRAQNIIHARNVLGKVIGIYGKKFCGENNSMSKMNWNKVEDIRYLYSTGRYSQSDLGRMFEMSQTSIGDIVSLRNWIK